MKPAVILTLILTALFLSSCAPSGTVSVWKPSPFSDGIEEAAFWYAISLPLEERAAQLFIAGIDGNSTLNEQLLSSSDAPGAFLFFSYNIAPTPEELIDFTARIKHFYIDRNKTPPFLLIDHEGGQVNRLRKIASPLPSASQIVLKATPEQACLLYELSARQLKALGFDCNLAPVTEPLTEENAAFLKTRSYGNAKDTALFTSAAITGMKSAGLASAIKHFPGNTGDDPHFGLPRLTVSKSVFDAQYLYPFRMAIFSKPDAILLSHIVVSAYDDKKPACLSEELVSGVLRQRFRFNGLIFSDDLYMGALAENGFTPEVAVTSALAAGVNMLMLSVKDIRDSQNALVSEVKKNPHLLLKLNESASRVITFKIKNGLLELKNTHLVPCSLPPSDQRLTDFSDAYFKAVSLHDNIFKIK